MQSLFQMSVCCVLLPLLGYQDVCHSSGIFATILLTPQNFVYITSRFILFCICFHLSIWNDVRKNTHLACASASCFLAFKKYCVDHPRQNKFMVLHWFTSAVAIPKIKTFLPSTILDSVGRYGQLSVLLRHPRAAQSCCCCF